MPEQQDIYDQEIQYLTEHPEEISHHWVSWSPLFAECGERGDQSCGCLTQVKNGNGVAANDALTSKILADERIPTGQSLVRIEHLPVFAEYQRLFDKMFQRRVPDSLERWI